MIESRKRGGWALALILMLLIGECINEPLLWATELRSIYRGARAQAMGNAFTAIADDEEAIFYNPAGLAGIRTFSLNLASVNAELSNEVLSNYATYTGALANPGLSTFAGLVGKNISIRGQGTASLVAPYFGVAGIYDVQVALRLKNAIFPKAEIGAQTTYGVQFGLGFPIRLGSIHHALRFGMAGKMLYRAGAFSYPTMTQFISLNTSAFIPSLASVGTGYGVDLGAQYIYRFKNNTTLQAGFAAKDVGDTAFTSGIAAQKMNLTAGIASTIRARDLLATFAFDYAYLADYIDWRRKTHFGLELKFPILRLYAGLNQLNASYGVSIDFWLLKLTYLSYGEELGSTQFQDTERRTLVQMVFKLDL